MVPIQEIGWSQFEEIVHSLSNLRAALGFVDVAILLDNSSARAPYRLVAEWRAGRLENQVPDPPSWCS